jgi:hypothetical protein
VLACAARGRSGRLTRAEASVACLWLKPGEGLGGRIECTYAFVDEASKLKKSKAAWRGSDRANDDLQHGQHAGAKTLRGVSGF